MNNLNQIIIEGKIAEKPNYQTAINGTKTCLLEISVERNYKNSSGEMSKEIDDFEIIAYGMIADFSKNFQIGDNIRVIGRLKQNKWTDSDGKKHSAINIFAEHIEKVRC